MIRGGSRVAALSLLAPFLALTSSLAPQHVHTTAGGHDHPVIHSHFTLHHVSAQHGADEVEADVEHVVWLGASALQETTFQIAQPAAKVPAIFEWVTQPTWSIRPSDEVTPAHGPPKAVQRFRGPPARLA